MSSTSTIPLSHFASLPYHVQEQIVDMIDHYGTYLALAVTCKYLSELCIRSLYQSLEFPASEAGKKPWADPRSLTRPKSVRFPQNVYAHTLMAKPELAVFTQQLAWDIRDDWSWHLATGLSICQLWSTFEQLTAVRTLDLRVNVSSYTLRPPASLFPRLVQARVQGTFPQDALEQVLLGSRHIRHLTIDPSTREYLHLPGEPYAYGTSIEPFLRTSISRQAFRGLRTLDLGLEDDVDPELVTQFVKMSAEWIEQLRIEYNFGEQLTAYENWVVPMLQSGRWRNLKQLSLPRLAIPQNPEAYIRAHCPALVSVSCEL
ncbi:hypothetical protein FRC12_008125 [Ceratobasidium sp. 428]|nr:hypothetical protein FRC12_008125 [Ceratobasidium sp. 428]